MSIDWDERYSRFKRDQPVLKRAEELGLLPKFPDSECPDLRAGRICCRCKGVTHFISYGLNMDELRAEVEAAGGLVCPTL